MVVFSLLSINDAAAVPHNFRDLLYSIRQILILHNKCIVFASLKTGVLCCYLWGCCLLSGAKIVDARDTVARQTKNHRRCGGLVIVILISVGMALPPFRTVGSKPAGPMAPAGRRSVEESRSRNHKNPIWTKHLPKWAEKIEQPTSAYRYENTNMIACVPSTQWDFSS